ncbi:MAG: prephenate dehydratase, partial [Kangiellaceae bacterium]
MPNSDSPDNSTDLPVKQDLSGIRTSISQLDNDLLSLLDQRRKLSQQVAENKIANDKQLRDQNREKQLLESLILKASKKGLDSHYVTNLYNLIIEDSVKLQKDFLQAANNETTVDRLESQNVKATVAILGGNGSYSYIAAKRFFSNLLSQKKQEFNSIDCDSFEAIIKSVERGDSRFGVIPIENTTSGGITAVYDLLLTSQLSIIGEQKQPIKHCLVAIEGADLESITHIAAHPEAALQCNKTLRRKTAAQINQVESTTHAIQKVISSQSTSMAAIASEEAANAFGLKIILKEIADQSENTTRFLVLAKNPVDVSSSVRSKVSIVLSTNQQPGALADILTLFKNADIPLTKLESRPIPNKPWQQLFYVDFEANVADEKVANCIKSLSKSCLYYRLLGCYPAQDTDTTQVSTKSLADAKLARLENSLAHNNLEAAKGSKLGENTDVKANNNYYLASRAYKKESTQININNHILGGDQFTVIAGPCAVESESQIESCAKHAHESGVSILRGGCFKPRTSPYSFQGLGLNGLDLLTAAGKRNDMPIITEVLNPVDVKPIAKHADILQVGTRNMQNFALLNAVGQVNCPVMLKRGLMATIDELLQAAEYILKQGNQQVFLCERGIR